PRGRDDERRHTADISELARQYGRYGYRKVAALLRQGGWTINDKRVERIWQREGLKVPHKQPKRGRLWLADGSCIRLRPHGPEPGRDRDDVCQRARHLGGPDHSEAIHDPKATEQFKHNDGRTNEAELKDAHADHHTPSAFFDSSRSSAQGRLVSAAFAIRAGGASLRRAGFDRSACPSQTAP